MIAMNNIDWDQVLVNAALSAMQGVQESKLGTVENFTPELLAKQSVMIAKALVKELKSEIGENEVITD